MPGQIRQIRRRIKSIDKIRQITRAMELVATSKIKRAEERISATRPYAQKMVEVMQNLTTQAGALQHPLLETHDPLATTGILVLTSNRGLAGAFNGNVLRLTEQLAKEEEAAGRTVKMFVAGSKGLSYLKYRGYEIAESYLNIPDAPTYDDAQMLATRFMEGYEARELDQVFIVFNHFKSAGEQRPTTFQVFPLETPEVEQEGPQKEYIFEPAAAELAAILLPAYAETVIYRTLLESAASEHGARRTAMKSATDNSEEIVADLTLEFNRARQAQITQELAEISGAVEALRFVQEQKK